MTRMLVSHLLIILLCAAGGFVCGLNLPHPLGTRGAILGCLLGLSIAASNFLNRKRLDAGRNPSWWSGALVVAVGTAICGAILDLQVLVGHVVTPSTDILLYAYLFLYFASLHLFYRFRFVSASYVNFRVVSPILIILGFVLINLCRLKWFYRNQNDLPAFIAVESVMPLAFAVVLSLVLFDPAWSHERWCCGRILPDRLGRLFLIHLPLILSGTAAGFLSGILMPHPLGTRGAILGFLLAMAVAVANYLNRARLDAGRDLDNWAVFPVFLSGALICLLACEYEPLKAIPKDSDFPLPEMFPPLPINFLVLVMYFLTMNFFYPTRFRPEERSRFLPLLILPIFYAINLLRFSFMPASQSGGAYIQAAFCALPFGVLWLVSLALLDPAWSCSRWARRGMNKPS